MLPCYPGFSASAYGCCGQCRTKPCQLSCIEYYHSRPEHTNITAASPIMPCFEPNAAIPVPYNGKYVNKKITYIILVLWSCFKPFCNIKSQNKKTLLSVSINFCFGLALPCPFLGYMDILLKSYKILTPPWHSSSTRLKLVPFQKD